MRLLDYTFVCDEPGCRWKDTYTVEIEASEDTLFLDVEDYYETQAMLNGWYPDDDGIWYCPECAMAKGLVRNPFTDTRKVGQ